MKLQLYNTLTRKKEDFVPINYPFVGLYVCGPTVYGDPHLGHARAALTFDLLFRLLQSEGYKVRYVRNITDVGHLEADADHGEDKIAKKARLEQLEPMEVAQYYTNRYHYYMHKLGVKDPSIEPLASGHIPEQIELVEQIIAKGYGYESNGSVYFDVEKYADSNNYGVLSGRKLEDMQSGGRSDSFTSEKRSVADFALWKKASPEHIMRWNSPWGAGFPGWHCECSAMSKKYLGENFDIHGGGMDLIFPHHESEMAQSTACNHSSAKYWVHNNMITMDGKKMGKSLGNAINLEQFFSGEHSLLEQPYQPMVIRFFMMQAHYRSTLDFSNEALKASEKGLERLLKAWAQIGKITPPVDTNTATNAENIVGLYEKCREALLDDMNSPIAIAHLFDATKSINAAAEGKKIISQKDILELQKTFDLILGTILGITIDNNQNDKTSNALSGAMEMIIDLRLKARENKDWAASDFIRDQLVKHDIKLKDGANGTDWELD